jgi:hypothetical protein
MIDRPKIFPEQWLPVSSIILLGIECRDPEAAPSDRRLVRSELSEPERQIGPVRNVLERRSQGRRS